MPMSETLGTISAIETAYLLPRMDSRSRTDLPSPAPALEAAASPVPAPALDPGLQRELLFRIIQVVAIIGAIGLGLYLLSR
jgi:hypothetical protein